MSVSRYDLHTHSTASDGGYTPTELVNVAAAQGITDLALTDHDSVAGLVEAQTAATAAGIRLIPAVEISVSWHEKSVHVVGLNVDAEHPVLLDGLHRLQEVRMFRAEEMGRRLERHGVPHAFDAVAALAGDGMITRTHFAQYLVSLGLAPAVKDVFGRYLTHGKPGYVPTQWAGLDEAVGWIRSAGGIAVVAHPQRYKLTASWLRRLLTDFVAAGGEGIEVVSGTGAPGDIDAAAAHARRFGLLASVGSDFHSPDHGWLQLGRLPPLPADLTPVWRKWNE